MVLINAKASIMICNSAGFVKDWHLAAAIFMDTSSTPQCRMLLLSTLQKKWKNRRTGRIVHHQSIQYLHPLRYTRYYHSSKTSKGWKFSSLPCCAMFAMTTCQSVTAIRVCLQIVSTMSHQSALRRCHKKRWRSFADNPKHVFDQYYTAFLRAFD